MTTAPSTLEHFGVLLVSGADARDFLQGQLTADLAALTPERILLAACNSPQGRVQAVLWLIERPDGIAVLLNRELVDTISTRLRRYVLRAKVAIEPQRLHVGLLEAPEPDEAGRSGRSHRLQGEVSLLQWSGHRHGLVVSPHAMPSSSSEGALLWHTEHLRAGLPQIYAATYERFVAQMLNLDVLDAISLTKGCYTGQEIIARTHYRGAIKRRMFRFRADASPPAPATRILAGDQHAGDVVDSVPTASGSELLAVVSLAQAHETLHLESNDAVMLEHLPLPYEVTGAQG